MFHDVRSDEYYPSGSLRKSQIGHNCHKAESHAVTNFHPQQKRRSGPETVEEQYCRKEPTKLVAGIG
jgi:hypothetical protein